MPISTIKNAGLEGTVPVLLGGTGATTAPAALAALGAQPVLVSGTSIKTLNSQTLLGTGDIVLVAAAPEPILFYNLGVN